MGELVEETGDYSVVCLFFSSLGEGLYEEHLLRGWFTFCF